MKLRLVTAFGAGFLTAVVIGFLRPGVRPQCRVGDLTLGVTKDQAKEMERLAGGWVHNVRECHVGDYVVDAPDREGSSEIMISRKGEPFLRISQSATTLLEGRRVLYQWDRGRSVISYAGYDPAKQAWIDNVDLGADGVVDYRTTEVAGQPVKQELRINDRWLELSKRNGQSGVVINGQFMSVSEARKALGETTIDTRAR